MKYPQMLLVIAALGMASTPADAGPLYSVVALAGTSTPTGRVDGIENSPTPGIVIQGTYTAGGRHPAVGHYFATADQGRLGGAVDATVYTFLGTPTRIRTTSSFEYDDLVFSAPTNMLIDVVLPLHISGNFVLGSTNPTPSLSIDVRTRIENFKNGFYQPAGGGIGGFANGILSSLSGFDIDTIVYARFQNVKTNVAHRFYVNLITDIQAEGGQVNGKPGIGSVDFSNTLSLVSNGPAFLVPDGVDVNSDQAGVVHNQFGPQSAVPEPSSLALFLLGGVSLAMFGRRRLTRPSTRNPS